jgi:hypothetical protein
MIRSTLLCLGGSVLLAAGVYAQQPGRLHDTTRAMGREMMMQQVQAADDRLDKLVREMNRATGAKKVEAMAAVVNEMLAQRKQMRAHMMQVMDSRGMMEGHPHGMMDQGQQRPADTMRMSPLTPDDSARHHDSP